MPLEHLAAFGLVVDGPVRSDDPPYYLWPSNARAWRFWLSLQSQWAWCGAGLAGMLRTGIPSDRVEAEMRLQRIRHGRQREMHALVRAAEAAALDAYREIHERALKR